MTESQINKLKDLGFVINEKFNGITHFGKQMQSAFLVITEKLEWYISLPCCYIDENALDTISSYSNYLKIVIKGLIEDGKDNTRKESSNPNN